VVPPAAPYEPLPPRVYAAKVKDLMTGMALTDDEYKRVTADPKVLRTLVDSWMTTEQFKAKTFEFFKSAFQQTQLEISDLDEQLRLNSGGINGNDQKRMLRSVEEMFANTAMALVDEGRPFTETVTTTRFKMNVPLMVALSYMDATPMDDKAAGVAAGYWLLNKHNAKTFKVTLVDEAVQGGKIPWADTINPASPNFMKLTFRQPPMPTNPGAGVVYMPCKESYVVPGTGSMSTIFRSMFGGRQSCQGAPSEATEFTDADWNTWRWVTVRQPAAGEERTTFWELDKLRDPALKEIVVGAPRVGFFTTLAFFANWPTNISNSYRVTTNQALIVALGRSFDDRATTVQVMETSVDAQHVTPGSPCFACHVTLDPMRDFFKQSYSMTYFEQLSTMNPKNPPLPSEGVFTVDSSPPLKGKGVHAFARGLAEHAHFAPAWTQKLCQLANSETCVEEDPEFKRVANAFKASKFDYRVLVRELFTSPLVTFASKTLTAEKKGVIMSIARREALCSRLSNRLGGTDLCNQKGEGSLKTIANQLKNLSLGVPGSAYSRADENPMTPHDPNLFFISGTEKMCMSIAGQVVELNATSPWKSAAKDAAIGDFVAVLMGVPPSDPRAPGLADILQRHYAAAINGVHGTKEKPADALRSTFTLACSSPLGISLGL